jgi:hypothetical protein
MKTTDEGFDSPVAKFLSDDEVVALRLAMDATTGDLILIVADDWEPTCEVLGMLRNEIGRPPVHEGPYKYVWVVEFPLFVGRDKETGNPKSGHHPFTMPHPDDIDKFESDPMSVRSIAYDLVLNGWELGSGSIRIHESELQRKVFRGLGISDEEAERKFGFFLNPFEYGAPPHGGFAFGLDRLVAILAGTALYAITRDAGPGEGWLFWAIVAAALAIGFLLLVSLLMSVALRAVMAFAEQWLPVPPWAMVGVELTISLGVVTFLFAAMFKILPDVVLGWRDVLGGALITALLFSVGRSLIAIYLANTATASTYGAAGSLALLLLWVNYSSLILLFGASITRAHAEARGTVIRTTHTAIRVHRQLIEDAE